MIEVKVVELVHKLQYLDAVCFHLWVVAARGFHNLVNDELQVILNIVVSYPELNGEAQTIDEGLIFCNIVRGNKVNTNDIPHVDAKG